MDRNIRRMPQENDIIVKELLDVQAATIGVKKLDDKMEKNATEKDKKGNCPRKLHSTLSYAEQRMCTLTCSRGATVATDKGNLIRTTPNVYIIGKSNFKTLIANNDCFIIFFFFDLKE